MIKILAASGGSKHAERAVRLACRLAQSSMTTLTTLTVNDPEENTPLEQVRSKALALAQQFDTSLSITHTSGHPEQVIRETVMQGYDLLIIGARGLRSMQDFFLGRNAIRLIRNLPVTTLVVRKTDIVRKILWRVPHGPINSKHIELIIHIVNTQQADLTILDVQPSAILFGHRKSIHQHPTDPCDLHGRLAELRTRIIEATGKEVACRVRSGIPEEVILDEAAIGNYDLVAVSAKPRRGLSKLFSDNIQYRAARNLPVSVLLLSEK